MLKYLGFQGSSVIKKKKKYACQCRRGEFNLWVRKIPGERRTCNPLQYSCLENPVHRGAWWATVHEVTKKSDMT